MERGRGIAADADRDRAPITVVTVPEEMAGLRLDRALARLLPEHSRSRLQHLIVAGRVDVAGATITKPRTVIEAGQRITIDLPPRREPDAPHPQALDLDIVFEDECIAVVNKPAGLVVHTGAGHHESTLVNGLLHRYGDALSCGSADDRPGIVHRLDKGTSGVMVIARNDESHRALADQFAARTVEKEYAAIVFGCPSEGGGLIDLPIGRDRADRTKVSANTDRPRDAATRWELAEPLGAFARLRAWPKTGRMHQIRVHVASIHHPCVGDDKYAGARWKGVANPHLRQTSRDFARPALHARRLRLNHPLSDERLEFVAPLPEDLETLLSALRSEPSQR